MCTFLYCYLNITNVIGNNCIAVLKCRSFICISNFPKVKSKLKKCFLNFYYRLFYLKLKGNVKSSLSILYIIEEMIKRWRKETFACPTLYISYSEKHLIEFAEICYHFCYEISIVDFTDTIFTYFSISNC